MLQVAGLRYHEEAEGYHSIANLHLCNDEAAAAQLKRVEVKSTGAISVTIEAGALRDPAELAKEMSKARAEALRQMVKDIPSSLRTIVLQDGLMHCEITRHHDPCDQPMPANFGLPTKTDMTLKTAQRILEDIAGLARTCVPDGDDATIVAVGLAMHAGRWSLEQLDDREPTFMLGEDCDDMVIRARSVFYALKRHLPRLRPKCDVCRRICKFIDEHQMLSCQGHASPPHPLKEPGQIIGHVYGLFVRDVDWKEKLKLKSGVPCEMTNNELYELLQPKLCEATAPCRALPAAAGKSYAKIPGLVEIRTTKGDESYQSVQQAQEDDCVVYFFQADKRGRWSGGINASDLLRPPGAPARPESKVRVLMLQADPKCKIGTDAEILMNEADPTLLEATYQSFLTLMAKYGVPFGMPDATRRCAAQPTYHLQPVFCESTLCSFKY